MDNLYRFLAPFDFGMFLLSISLALFPHQHIYAQRDTFDKISPRRPCNTQLGKPWALSSYSYIPSHSGKHHISPDLEVKYGKPDRSISNSFLDIGNSKDISRKLSILQANTSHPYMLQASKKSMSIRNQEGMEYNEFMSSCCMILVGNRIYDYGLQAGELQGKLCQLDSFYRRLNCLSISLEDICGNGDRSDLRISTLVTFYCMKSILLEEYGCLLHMKVDSLWFWDSIFLSDRFDNNSLSLENKILQSTR